MKDHWRTSFVGGVTLFFVFATIANVGVSALYVRGVSHLSGKSGLEQRDLRVLGRPLQVKVADRTSKTALEDHLRRIGYYEIAARERGCFTSELESLTIWSRFPELDDVTLRWSGDEIISITTPEGVPLGAANIESETIMTAMLGPAGTLDRISVEPLPYAAIDGTPLFDAVIASEDRGFRTHHGIDWLRMAAVPWYGGGASTITMQMARLNVLHDRRRTLDRKLSEIGLAMAIDRSYSKNTILTAYAETVDLGARRGRPVHGFAAAAREFFAVDDVRQLSALQAATIVAMLNQPSRYLGDLHDGDDSRLKRQRNRVLRLMHRNFPDRYSDAWVHSLEEEPVVLSAPPESSDALHRASRHFLDYALASAPEVTQGRIYLTLDPDIQRIAADVVEQGLSQIAGNLPVRLRPQLQAALIAIDPATGEVLAMVGGRSFDASQFNRTLSASRQVGSILKPFVYLAAFERAANDNRKDVTPETQVIDEPAVFNIRGQAPWRPTNYDGRFAGTMTWRRAFAESRNVPAVKVAAWAGFDRVTSLWASASGQRITRVFPSIALGAVQATPADVATAYATFATDGVVRPLTGIKQVVSQRDVFVPEVRTERRVARPETVSIVRDMLRTAIDEGTGRRARDMGLMLEAAGKTGTTDALRDAWFAGFVGNVLAVVWVGRDDDQPVGLSGSQAALPIWTEFMKRALQSNDDVGARSPKHFASH